MSHTENSDEIDRLSAELNRLRDELVDSREVLAEMDKLVAGLRERNAEMLAALKDLDDLLDFDGLPESGSGYQFWGTDFIDFNQACARARAAIARAESTAKPDFPPEAFT